MTTTTATLTAGTYERVSRLAAEQTEQHERERSVDQQRADNEKACAQRGWPIVARYADPGRSASRFATRARENWRHVLDAVNAREFDVLVVWETSRASRDTDEWFPLLTACRRTGVQIYVTNENELYDPSKPRQWKTLATAGVDNAFSSEETSMRVKRGVAAHAAEGKPYGTVPYGYDRLYDPRSKAFVEQRPNPDTAPVVKDIITRVYRGESLMSIANKLNDDGIPSPRGARWSMRVVRRVALNPAYIGLRSHNGATVPGVWQGLVEEQVFYGAQRILTDPKRTTTKPGRAKWLASCIARCGVCGGWLSVAYRGANRTVYQCRDHGCVWIEREDLDEYLTEGVYARLAQPDTFRELPNGADESAVEGLRGQLAALRAQLDAYADDAAEGKISAGFAASVASKIEAKIAGKLREIEGAVTPPALAGLLSGDPDENVADRWERAPVSARREVLRLLFGSIAVAKGPGLVSDRVTIG